jgi:hypothetical protein
MANTAPKLVTLREAGRRLNPDRPLCRRHVDRLAAQGALTKLPWPDAPNGRIKVGITPQSITGLLRRRRRKHDAR